MRNFLNLNVFSNCTKNNFENEWSINIGMWDFEYDWNWNDLNALTTIIRLIEFAWQQSQS